MSLLWSFSSAYIIQSIISQWSRCKTTSSLTRCIAVPSLSSVACSLSGTVCCIMPIYDSKVQCQAAEIEIDPRR